MNQNEKEYQVINWLKNYEAYKQGVANLNELITDIAEEGFGIDYSKDSLSPSNAFSSDVENKVIKLEKLDLTAKVKSMSNVIHSIDMALNCLTEREREVIVSRYIKSLYYYQFCHKIYVSEITAKRIRKSALRKMVIVIFGSNATPNVTLF